MFPHLFRGLSVLCSIRLLCRFSILAASGLCTAWSSETEAIILKPVDAVSFDYVSEETENRIREENVLRTPLIANFAFDVPEDGWYEFIVHSGSWPTSFRLDGEYFFYGVLEPVGFEPEEDGTKLRNVYLTKGSHELVVERGWHPGPPRIQEMRFRPAESPEGMVYLDLEKDYLVYRKGESVPVALQAGQTDSDYEIMIQYVDSESGEVVSEEEIEIPVGPGFYEETIYLPTDREGILDVVATGPAGQVVNRTFQYLTIDTDSPPEAPWSLELVESINSIEEEPEYGSGRDKVVERNGLVYREGGEHGHMEKNVEADWFAYELDLPEVGVPYLLEIEYADDDRRNWTYSLIEKEKPWGRTLTHGILSGGIYSLTDQMQTTEMVFYNKETNPRVHFRNWWKGQPAAVSKINVYRITGGFPAMPGLDLEEGRLFGRYQEEPGRFTQWTTSMEDDSWLSVWQPAERIGRYSRFVGANFWKPTISVYGDKLWPTRFIPEQGFNGGGFDSSKEQFPRDTVRLLALVAEKYNMQFMGQLYPRMQRDISRRYFTERITGVDPKGDVSWKDADTMPWVAMHRSGKNNARGNAIFLNPAHPGVQDWVADVVTELADRYQDLPSYGGVAIRHMAWQFPGWQAWPNIEYGYDDWTVSQFEEDTGIEVPVDEDDPKRFEERYQWMTKNVYQEWVDWRADQIETMHLRLLAILQERRPDWKLNIDVLRPDFRGEPNIDRYDRLGWAGMLRETGIDPDRYRDTPSIVINDWRHYPAGARSGAIRNPSRQGSRFYSYLDPDVVGEAYRNVDGGRESGVHFDANSYESDLAYGDELGYSYEETTSNKKMSRPKMHGAGMVFPAGRHFLERFANAMADGNTTMITDGSHAYISWPPKWLREWMPHYRALPNIGMERIGSGDPVALWLGKSGDSTYFYLVNRLDEPVEAQVSFLEHDGNVVRLVDGQTMEIDDAGFWQVQLEPYELISLKTSGDNRPVSFSVQVSEEGIQRAERQVATVEDWLQPDGKIENAVSPKKYAAAQERFEVVQQALADGEYHKVRQNLYHPDLWTIFVQLDEYPPELWNDRTPVPQGEW
ncbi:family 10 glycosylhydrolase [Puniceicoccus vermicola]|uniref:Family 10 glycosylhydrolase n=1 Tax=Puniceicoccus vermicola TaxID=388746 RepID=A0A7X1E529_9BACT|nr:family 10 glycosylhydrolase [Puniceicoccus vermicola]MBC2602613.1 family 10 glycosylhydrolase [Puniceicoccus vermicola]